MIETGPGFFWNRGLGLGLDNNNLTLVSVESGACAMTRLWLWLAALGTKMYQGLPALKYCLIIRAVSPWSKKVNGAVSPSYKNVPRAASPEVPCCN